MKPPHLRTLAAAVLMVGMAAASASAQIRITVDNDLFRSARGGRGAAGLRVHARVRVSWTRGDRATEDGEGRRRTRFEIKQRIYTPRRDAPERFRASARTPADRSA